MGTLFPKAAMIGAQEKDVCNCEGGQTPAQVVQRGCGDSMLGDTQNPDGHSTGRAALSDPA